MADPAEDAGRPRDDDGPYSDAADEEHVKLLGYIYAVAEMYGFDHSEWSIEIDPATNKAIKFDRNHPFTGARRVVYITKLGDCVAPVDGPLWIDLWRAADNCIRASADAHHPFIEDFTFDSNFIHDRTLYLHCGS